MEIKKFEFEGNEISFLTGDNTMINATEMAKQFEVQPAFWLRTDPAKRLIEAISAMHGCIPTDLVVVRNGGNDFGTWMHEDVALVFAQWLSPEFYIWCNDRIKELFKYGITALNKEIRSELFSLWKATEILMNNSECKVGRYQIYKDLSYKQIIYKHGCFYIPYQKYIDEGYFVADEESKYPSNTRYLITKEGLNYLINLLYPQPVNYDNSKLFEYIQTVERKLDAIGKNILHSKSSAMKNATHTPTREEQELYAELFYCFGQKAIE